MRDVVESEDGYFWSSRGPETDDHLAFGGHEPALEPLLQSMASKDKLYVNVGAHVGSWAIRMHKFSKAVFAFEANPQTYDTLIANIDYNGVRSKVTPICRPVWDTDGLYFGLVDENNKPTGGSTRIVPSGTMTNASVTLDTFFERAQKQYGNIEVGLISMDVEGAEAHVLRGASSILKKDRPNLIIELHEGHPGTAIDLRAQVEDFLDDHGYDYFSVHVANPEEHIIARPAENLTVFTDIVEPQ